MATRADSACDPIASLRDAVVAAARTLADGELPRLPTLDRPPKLELGDFATNAAMLLAPLARSAPREVAPRLAAALADELGERVTAVDVAGPGFLNLRLADAWFKRALAQVLAASDAYGRPLAAGPRERILVEFVSANPTGPITVASGRHAAYGDALCRLLEFCGHTVEREYYVNDAGSQVERFARSIAARARGEEPPDDGYRGDYVAELAGAIDGAADLDTETLARRGVEAMMASVKGTLERFGVRMDRYFSERSLHESGAIERALEQLARAGHTYEADGALWLRTTAFGDDKDRVLRRSNGEYTYFAADIAYHADKLARLAAASPEGGYRAIDVLGADHHGYVGRMRAAWQALGGESDRLELVIMQLVHLVEGGSRAQMSKRAGTVVTLDELVSDIGVDAARWFLLSRSHDTTLELDLDLARSQAQENPVFYVQYAHARIASILRRAGTDREAAVRGCDVEASPETLAPAARELLLKLFAFPSEVGEAAALRAPHRLTAYLLELARSFSAFYRDCRVLGAGEEGGDEDFRLAVCLAVRDTLARGLGLLGIAAPDEM
ncbi:MAG: arginine--tRNA ligase [Thermoleophilum sp.]|nr:arginine--tRNA ligase [Thermoleophilum sp.]